MGAYVAVELVCGGSDLRSSYATILDLKFLYLYSLFRLSWFKFYYGDAVNKTCKIFEIVQSGSKSKICLKSYFLSTTDNHERW